MLDCNMTDPQQPSIRRHPMSVLRPAKADEALGSASAHGELEAFLAKHPQVQFVDCVFVDLCGQVRGKRYPRGEVEKVFKSGLQIPYSLYLLDARGEMANPLGRGLNDGDPDGTAWPVPGTLTAVSWAQRPHAQVLMTLGDENGQPYLGEPRHLLKRIAERFRDLELTPVVAGEIEFFLIDRERKKRGRRSRRCWATKGRAMRRRLPTASTISRITAFS
jgi:glutamine synthetase